MFSANQKAKIVACILLRFKLLVLWPLPLSSYKLASGIVLLMKARGRKTDSKAAFPS